MTEEFNIEHVLPKEAIENSIREWLNSDDGEQYIMNYIVRRAKRIVKEAVNGNGYGFGATAISLDSAVRERISSLAEPTLLKNQTLYEEIIHKKAIEDSKRVTSQ